MVQLLCCFFAVILFVLAAVVLVSMIRIAGVVGRAVSRTATALMWKDIAEVFTEDAESVLVALGDTPGSPTSSVMMSVAESPDSPWRMPSPGGSSYIEVHPQPTTGLFERLRRSPCSP